MASFFSSAVFCRRYFRDTTMLAWAALSARFACSTVSVRPSGSVSPAPPMFLRDSVASVILLTSVSAAETLTSTSSSRCDRLRSAVLVRNCCKRSRPSSKRFCSMSISSLTVLAGPSVKRATSTSFLATKVWASARAACTLTATLSASTIRLSMSGIFSPRKNGSSASAIFCSSSSALLTFSETSLSKVSAAMRTCVSLMVLRTSSSFSCACFARSCRALISSRNGPGFFSALLLLVSMSRMVCESADCAALNALSVSLMPSLLSPPRGAVIMAAFSTSISAPASLPDSSSKSFLACTRCS
mmetsp:Transcript_2583/g.5863  ORF Transcript_2583/g.5863 Transcript_2583/m.5863 type:complete len:301 (+) Transcript_2583:1737-2639(+)